MLSEMNLIIESNFLCHKLWLQSKNLKNHDFNKFLSLRKKRLSATMILLSDLSNWKFTTIEEKNLGFLQEIGYLIEVISIVAHDLLKYKVQSEHNIYCYWLDMKRYIIEEAENMNIRKEFLDEIKAVIYRKKASSKVFRERELGKEYKKLIEQVGGLLKQYYKFDEVDGLRDIVLSPRL